MPEMDTTAAKPPQISEMFQKFALAFKTKTFEFFSDENPTTFDDSDGFSLLDSAEEIITDQKVVVIKPDPNPSHNFSPGTPPPQSPPQPPPPQSPPQPPPPQITSTPPSQTPEPETTPTPLTEAEIRETTRALISSIFAAVSAFEASYFQLQSAHVPFVEEHVKSADRVLVSHLQRLSELKKFYCNPDSRVFPFGSCLEAQVEENQSKLRTLGTVSNRLQSELEHKHDEVLALRRKLDDIHKGNVNLSKKLCASALNPSCDVLLTVRVFDSLLHDASRATHKFTKILIGLMRKAGWDLGLAANAVHPDVGYAKKGHNQYALLSYVCLGMFQGFDLANFGVEVLSNGHACDDEGGLDLEKKSGCLKQLLEHVSSNPMDLLGIHPGCEFSRFCEHKYERLIHPSMESSIFVDLEEKQAVLNSWRSLSMFYEAFVGMASSIWTLHKLSYAFDPAVEIFQVERGVEFSMIYMEDVTKRLTWPNKGRAKVGFTVVPGFRIGRIVIQSQVYISNFSRCGLFLGQVIPVGVLPEFISDAWFELPIESLRKSIPVLPDMCLKMFASFCDAEVGAVVVSYFQLSSRSSTRCQYHVRVTGAFAGHLCRVNCTEHSVILGTLTTNTSVNCAVDKWPPQQFNPETKAARIFNAVSFPSLFRPCLLYVILSFDGLNEYPVVAESRAGNDAFGVTLSPGTVTYVTTGGFVSSSFSSIVIVSLCLLRFVLLTGTSLVVVSSRPTLDNDDAVVQVENTELVNDGSMGIKKLFLIK
ncbi:hypothetical protein RJT34_19025 [Clitoria ternatea]|uniref:DUF641 domain-containing protein n=1 Tax=Clitoria ternatea TaxID=43366 RepID=A0AAN9IQJ8_CLITE